MDHDRTLFCMGDNRFHIDCANQPHDGRTQSEDYILADLDTELLGIFDSVGGRDHGLLVSHLAGKMDLTRFWMAEEEKFTTESKYPSIRVDRSIATKKRLWRYLYKEGNASFRATRRV